MEKRSIRSELRKDSYYRLMGICPRVAFVQPSQGFTFVKSVAMRFSIIVPVFNCEPFLGKCIAALKNLDYPRDQYEILFVDNNSTDRSFEILSAATGIRIMHEPTQGSYAARNRALKEARGDIVAFTDSDCAPSRGWLRAAERALEVPGCQAVLGRRRPRSEKGLMRLLADYECTKDEYVLSSSEPSLYYGYTNNMAVRRDSFEQCGLFDLRARGSDTLFIQKIIAWAGCASVIYSVDMIVAHLEMSLARDYLRKVFIYGRSQQAYRQIGGTRALETRERIAIWHKTAQLRRYKFHERTALFLALAGGLVAWNLGSLVAQSKNSLAGSPRIG